MQSHPLFDRALLIPIGISILSILGICLIFSTSGLVEAALNPTAIPSGFVSRAAATRTPSPLATSTREETPPPSATPTQTRDETPSPSATSTQDQTPPTATGAGPDSYPGPFAKAFPSTGTLVMESLPAPSATDTPYQIPLLGAGKYDDTDPNIAYDRSWAALKNPSTAVSYKGTIHASSNTGSEASFRFTGERLQLGYQRGKSFGTVTVLIDDQTYSFHEQAFDLVWRSPKLSPGDHFVRIIHQSGESVNLDYIVILD